MKKERIVNIKLLRLLGMLLFSCIFGWSSISR